MVVVIITVTRATITTTRTTSTIIPRYDQLASTFLTWNAKQKKNTRKCIYLIKH